MERRSPSWGAWIEISCPRWSGRQDCRRSPSWGAWIEISFYQHHPRTIYRRSPSWGAWIEIILLELLKQWQVVKSLPLVGSVD